MPTSPFNPACLTYRVALITGGGSGIGFEISKQLGLHGARVVIMGRREAVLLVACQKLREKGITCAYVQGNVLSADDAKRAVNFAVNKFGRLDILVNGAAGNFLSLAEDTSTKGYETIMKTDYLGMVTMCNAAFPELKKHSDLSHASIINISAMLHRPATLGLGAAAAAKSAIEALTRNHALEWGVYGICSNTVAPGIIADTPGFAKLGGNLNPDILQQMIEAAPLKRLTTTMDVALMCVYLCSAAGRNVNGVHLVNDGGGYLNPQLGYGREAISFFSKELRGKEKAKVEQHSVKLTSKL